MDGAPERTAAANDPDCARCRHHVVTYEPRLPHGCLRFGIKTAALPAREVRRASGEPCRAFEPRPSRAPGPPR